MTDPAPAEDKSKAACAYIDESLAGLTRLKTAVCDKSGASEKPGPSADLSASKPADLSASKPAPKEPPKSAAMTKESIEAWIADKKSTNTFLDGATVTENGEGAYDIAVGGKTITLTVTAGTIDEQATAIATTLGPEGTTKIAGGRRRKRSARKGRKSFKGGRRSRKGGRKSRGCKGRRSRGRTIKGGAKMSKELKAWMERQKKATGLTAISKKTIDAAKTTSQATGSEQRSESGKHVAAKNRGF